MLKIIVYFFSFSLAFRPQMKHNFSTVLQGHVEKEDRLYSLYVY